MERYLFTQDGYRCVDVDGTILHQSEKHEDLFQFVDKEETPIYELLRDYLKASIDIETLTPIEKDDKKRIYREMLSILYELHPFCDGDYLDREIARYFNDKLAQTCIKSAVNPSANILKVTESQYKAMFHSLFPLGTGIEWDADDFRHRPYYTHLHNILSDEEEYNSFDTPFADLHRAKLLIKDYLYWVLDSQAEPFCDMTLAQRLYIYNAYHHPETFKIADTEIEYYWGNEDGIRFDGTYMGIRHEVPLTVELPDGRCMAEAVQGISSSQAYETLSLDAKEILEQMISETKNRETLDEYCAVYSIRNLFTLLFIECQRMYEAKVSIRRCERCGHYFIASKRMYKYCERLIDDELLQSCRDVGAKENAKKKLSDDPIYYLYNKAYRTHHARIRAGHITKQEFDAWATEAKRRMNAVLDNPSLLDAYEEWLKI